MADKAVGAKGFKATWTEIKVEYSWHIFICYMMSIILRIFLPVRIKMNSNAEIHHTASPENCNVTTSETAGWMTDPMKWIVNLVFQQISSDNINFRSSGDGIQ